MTSPEKPYFFTNNMLNIQLLSKDLYASHSFSFNLKVVRCVGKDISFYLLTNKYEIQKRNHLWNSSTLATSCQELTHWKRLWCWEGLGAGGEGDDRGWDGWMASPTRWMWVWVNSGSWWWTGRPGVLRFMGSQRVGYDWATELNWTEERMSLEK